MTKWGHMTRQIVFVVLDCYLYKIFICIDLNRKVTVAFWVCMCSTSTDLFSSTNIQGTSIGSIKCTNITDSIADFRMQLIRPSAA